MASNFSRLSPMTSRQALVPYSQAFILHSIHHWLALSFSSVAFNSAVICTWNSLTLVSSVPSFVQFPWNDA
jgi:hypothetical protein